MSWARVASLALEPIVLNSRLSYGGVVNRAAEVIVLGSTSNTGLDFYVDAKFIAHEVFLLEEAVGGVDAYVFQSDFGGHKNAR